MSDSLPTETKLWVKPEDLHTHSPDCRGSGCIEVALNQGPRRDDGVGSNPDLSAQDRHLPKEQGGSWRYWTDGSRTWEPATLSTDRRLTPKYRGRNGYVYFDGIKDPIIKIENLAGAYFCEGDLATFLAEKLNHERLCREKRHGG